MPNPFHSLEKTVSTFVAAGVACLAMSCARQAPVESEIENILLISIDALNPSALRAYNVEAQRLPNLDAMASEAVVFTNAYSTASWTLPSHASLLTGLYPDRHGAVAPGRRLPRDMVTLASILRDSGRETVGFTGGGYMSGGYGLGAGFQRYNGFVRSKDFHPRLALPENGKEDGELFDRAIAYLKDVASSKRPFFLFVHTYYVHDYFKMRRGDAIDESLKPCLTQVSLCGPEEWKKLQSLYIQRVSELDEALGRLFDVLKETGLADSTLMVLTSDHGEGFDPARGRIHHTGRLDRDALHVPLMFSGPGLSPSIVEDDVSLVDVMPTILELASQSDPPFMEGVSLVDELYGRERGPGKRRALLAMEHTYRWVDGVREDVVREEGEGPLAVAVLAGSLHYIREGDREALYNVRADPREEHNLADHSSVVVGFRDLLERRSHLPPSGEAVEMDEELREQLRSLGYLQ